MCRSNAGTIELGTIEVGVLGLDNRRRWRWNVCFIFECLFVALYSKIVYLRFLFGVLIDRGFSIEQIAIISSIYISISLFLLFLIRNKLNPTKI